MSTQQSPYSCRLSLLEAFRTAAWGKNTFIKSCKPHPDRTIEYLDFGEHLLAVQSFCHAVDDKLVVFQEYNAAMERFKEGDAEYKKGACIIGQPGIGKSCFVAYAVIERLREEQPVAVEVAWSRMDPKYLLFTATAVSLHNENQTHPLEDHPQIWTFSDSNSAALEPSLAFQNTHHNVRIFQTTLPAEQRWKGWTKQRDIDLYIMDVPSIEEVKDVAFILGKDMQRMESLANKCGPIPRILLRIPKVPQREMSFEQEVANGIYQAFGNPRSVFSAIGNHNSSPTLSQSSMVFFIKPKSKTRRNLCSIYVPTCWLITQLADRLAREKEDVRANFFDAMSRSPFVPHSMAEDIVCYFLAHGENFTIRWYNQEIGTGGPVLTVPPGSFGFKFLESTFDIDTRAGTGSVG